MLFEAVHDKGIAGSQLLRQPGAVLTAIFSIVVSTIALSVSIVTFLNGRVRDRRDMFLKIHETLISDDLQRGRQVAYVKLTDEASVETLSDQEYREINRALGTYNMLGVFLVKGYVNRDDVMTLWAEPIVNFWRTTRCFIDQREHAHGFRPYKHFEMLAAECQNRVENTEPA